MDTASTEENLQSIIDAMRNANPCADIIVAGMKAPPNMGKDFATVFDSLFATLAQANDVLLIPFLLEGVAAEPSLNQQDGIHIRNSQDNVILNNQVSGNNGDGIEVEGSNATNNVLENNLIGSPNTSTPLPSPRRWTSSSRPRRVTPRKPRTSSDV